MSETSSESGSTRPETRPDIYLGTDGAYHDDTPQNREQFPAAEDQVEDIPAPADATQTTDTPDVTGQTLQTDTVTPAGDQAGPADSAPAGSAAPDQTAQTTQSAQTKRK